MEPQPHQWKWRTGAAIVLLLSAAAQFVSIREEAQTFDEAVHLMAGYAYWRTGDLRWNYEHPPLSKAWNALPLLWIDPKLPVEHSSWAARDQYEAAGQFLYHNRVPAETLLYAARSMTILLTLLMGVAVWAFARWLAGEAAGLGAMALVLFEPNLLAHGRYVTTDVPLTAFAFMAWAAWIRFVWGGGWRWAVWSGLAFGAALSSKFSGVVLLLFVPIGAVAAVWLAKLAWRRALAGFALVLLLVFATVSIVYAPEGPRLLPGIRLLRRGLPSVTNIGDETATARAIVGVGRRIGIAESTWLKGIADVAKHDSMGHETYLLGEIRRTGWWYYFPVAFGVKTAAGLVLAIALAVVAAIRTRERDVRIAFLLLPAIGFLVVSMLSSINIGLRHLLPIYPILAVAAAALLVRARWANALMVCGLIAAAECAWIHPYYLSFFNVFAGGASNGPKYLLDSNIDWGQDLIRAKRYIDSQRVDHVCFHYFGMGDLDYYKIKAWAIPLDPAGRGNLNCLTMVSVTLLNGLYVAPGEFDWLRDRKPDASVGYSIRVYDLRKK